jgi:hypothetical protein
MIAAAADIPAAFFKKSRLPSLTTIRLLSGGVFGEKGFSISTTPKKTASTRMGRDAVVHIGQTKNTTEGATWPTRLCVGHSMFSNTCAMRHENS